MTRSGPDPDRPDNPSAQANAPRTDGNPDACRIVHTESGPALIRGTDDLTDQDRAAIADVLAAAQRRYAREHPDQEQPDA